MIGTTTMYTHSTLHDVLVQDAHVYNPGSRFVQLGIVNWGTAMSVNKVNVQGDGMVSMIKLFVASALWCVIYFVEAPQGIKGKSST